MKKTVSKIAAGLVCLFISLGTLAQEYKNLMWDELMPEDFIITNPFDFLNLDDPLSLNDDDESAIEAINALRRELDNAPIIAELDGEKIKIPGYIVPLEYRGKNVTEFLLVPYFGACIHTPPPPANQIVFVKYDEGIDEDKTWDPIYVSGELKATRVSSEIAEAGYTLLAHKVVPYME